jgi:hypothetical protein
MLSSLFTINQTVNHSKNLIDPCLDVQTQTIECLWKHMKVKYGIRAHGATNLLKRQLQEEWWRSANQKNVFDFFKRYKKTIFVKK